MFGAYYQNDPKILELVMVVQKVAYGNEMQNSNMYIHSNFNPQSSQDEVAASTDEISRLYLQ